MFKNFFTNESGQGMVEYGLIIALIAVVVIVALKALGGSISGIFNGASEVLDESIDTTGTGTGTPAPAGD